MASMSICIIAILAFSNNSFMFTRLVFFVSFVDFLEKDLFFFSSDRSVYRLTRMMEDQGEIGEAVGVDLRDGCRERQEC